MRPRSAALPFHRADVLLVYGAAGILIVTLGLIASGRDQREAAARPAMPAASSASATIVPAPSPGGFGVRPARRDDQLDRDERRRDEPRIVQALYDVRRSVF